VPRCQRQPTTATRSFSQAHLGLFASHPAGSLIYPLYHHVTESMTGSNKSNLPRRLRRAQSGELPDAAAGLHHPDALAEPPEHGVNRLVPFVKVTDVERSVGFYRNLGFTVQSEFKYRGRLSWAALESDAARVMFEGTIDPIESDRQGVLFYLYSHDLTALREQLLAAGIEAGQIEDGSPGPRQEMRVADPDGYVLRVAQIE
jgi:catechol 2,3-dioxygenase-like lactoylglutathione lyase family enzyme